MKKQTARDRYPLLNNFAEAYLHQDIGLESGTPAKAAAAYVAVLSPEERRALTEEAAHLHEVSRNWTPAEVNRTWDEMGSSWIFHSVQELDSVLKIFLSDK